MTTSKPASFARSAAGSFITPSCNHNTLAPMAIASGRCHKPLPADETHQPYQQDGECHPNWHKLLPLQRLPRQFRTYRYHLITLLKQIGHDPVTWPGRFLAGPDKRNGFTVLSTDSISLSFIMFCLFYATPYSVSYISLQREGVPQYPSRRQSGGFTRSNRAFPAAVRIFLFIALH